MRLADKGGAYLSTMSLFALLARWIAGPHARVTHTLGLTNGIHLTLGVPTSGETATAPIACAPDAHARIGGSHSIHARTCTHGVSRGLEVRGQSWSKGTYSYPPGTNLLAEQHALTAAAAAESH